MSLDEFRSWLYLSTYQYKSQMQQGWLFRGEYVQDLLARMVELETDNYSTTSSFDDSDKFPETHLTSLGLKLAGAIYRNQAVSLSAVGNWLLMGAEEDPDAPPNVRHPHQLQANFSCLTPLTWHNLATWAIFEAMLSPHMRCCKQKAKAG